MFYNYLIFNMVTLSLRILLKYCVSLYETKIRTIGLELSYGETCCMVRVKCTVLDLVDNFTCYT